MAVSFLSFREIGRPAPALDGRLHPRFEPVAAALRRQLRTYAGGAAVCVYYRGECVVDLWGGAKDDAGTPWRADTMAPSFSTTKGVTATTLHVMVDRGLLDFDDCVATHWPEFAQAGKSEITVRQVLSHQSGLYHVRQMIDHSRRLLDWEYMIHAIERARPIHAPGERTGYHGITFGFLVGELVRRVSGMPFSDAVQEAVARPLGVDGLHIGAPREVLHRAAELIWRRPRFQPPRLMLGGSERFGDFVADAARVYEQAWKCAGIELDLTSMLDALAPRGINSIDFGADETLRAAIPAVNGLFTARSLARMYAALAGDGEIGATRLLSRATLLRAAERQKRLGSLRVIPFDMRWRLGDHGVATTRGFPEHAFGHFGFGGSGAWADPSQRLAVALIVNSGMGTPFGDLRIARIGGAVLDSLRR